ncbi:PREDICTED: uncharacterized protein LOC105365288 [Ceratosolen solmsi marchali]|uniref:Uncharacterized protein LOC105365288 n=1 Tax=Ceratosolen solmsi marchali TaxID=326594 RepID=A0AAJ6YP75_9HYME|nr:PREDICTED: uncharacterized protein LOC105365288 [Ceratosolen solmsi marchali]
MNNLYFIHGRDMIQRMTRSQDSSFLCLLAIYAAHVVLFHVFDVMPFFGTTNFRLNEMAKSHFDRIMFKDNNNTNVTNTKNKNNNNVFEKGDVKSSLYFRDLQREQSKHELQKSLRCFQCQCDRFKSHHVICYSKVNFNYFFRSIWIHQIKNAVNIFATFALSSSTWGIISGCAIFLLTNADPQNTL